MKSPVPPIHTGREGQDKKQVTQVRRGTMEAIYLSLVHTGSGGNLFHKIPGMLFIFEEKCLSYNNIKIFFYFFEVCVDEPDVDVDLDCAEIACEGACDKDSRNPHKVLVRRYYFFLSIKYVYYTFFQFKICFTQTTPCKWIGLMFMNILYFSVIQ